MDEGVLFPGKVEEGARDVPETGLQLEGVGDLTRGQIAEDVPLRVAQFVYLTECLVATDGLGRDELGLASSALLPQGLFIQLVTCLFRGGLLLGTNIGL